MPIFLMTGCAHARFEPIAPPLQATAPISQATPEKTPAVQVPPVPVVPVSTPPAAPQHAVGRLPLGEKLHYTVYWLGIAVLKGQLQADVSPMIEEDPPLIHVNAAVRSTGLARQIFSVRDQVSSLIDPRTLLPRQFQLSLRHRAQIQERVMFQHDQGTAISIRDVSKSISIPSDARDVLSAFYYLRTLELYEGKPLAADVVADGRTWHLVASVHRRGRLTLKQGTFEALEIEVKASWLETYLKHQTVWLWVTTDPTHTPLMLRVKMPVVGNLTAILDDRRPEWPPVIPEEPPPLDGMTFKN